MVLSELMQSMFVVFSSCFAYLDFLFHRVVFSLSLSLSVCVCVCFTYSSEVIGRGAGGSTTDR